MINVGVDLHKTQMTVCYLADDHQTIQKVYRTDQSGYEAFCDDLQALNVPRDTIRIGVETTGNVWIFVKKVERHAGEVRVVNTMKFKVIVSSTSKTDRRDARTIAEYLRKDLLPTVTLPDADSRMIAKYVKVRDRYVKLATRLKNQIHALFAEEGICLKTADLSSDIRLRALTARDIIEEVRFLVEGLVEELIRLKSRIRELERKLNEMTREDRAVKLLRSIPGTGIVNACAVRGIVADVERFDDPKKMAAYAGLALMRMIECGGATWMWQLASASVGEQFERDNSAWPYHEERLNDFKECHGPDGNGNDPILGQRQRNEYHAII